MCSPAPAQTKTRHGSKTAALANSGAKTSLPQDLWQSRRSPPPVLRPCPVPVLHALSFMLRRCPAQKDIPCAVPSLLQTFTSPGEGAGPGSRPAPACPVSLYRPGPSRMRIRAGRERMGSACRVQPAWVSLILDGMHDAPYRKCALAEKALWPRVHSGSTIPRSGTTRGSAQQAGPRSRRDASVACLHLLLLSLFRPPPFREEFLQPDDSPGLVVAQDFRFACSLSKLPHELPARSARQDNSSIRLDSDNFSDGALPMCYHAGNGISFCTHAQGAGGINADADMDVPVS